ncbi:efflux RND transporter periplasmic adaptor subunit [Acidisoma cellulosilytica]|uniref:Efflux RND transporter periplasmic adaptor subunit n=1 Tax=Acidisoma cellulosilyticum TaxID=2802395 RepID=A0A964E4T3_9PROT|nr:efflux RND transporter periplasmic adaptor subunit [Acidisoma cellulosilyticum]MCB8881789.1 efflux RND transporter periplasmic adaptor subunit [Acidisoma cellulosilyticum]
MTDQKHGQRLARALLLTLLGATALTLAGPEAHAQRRSKSSPNDVTPVTVVPVTKQDVPVVLTGIGTVQASNTVTISPMVTGPIVSINFTEGQNVKKGDVLAVIDPRTYQATLDEDRGKLAQDQATLAGALRDLTRYAKLSGSSYISQQTADDERATVDETKALIIQDKAAIELAQTNLDYCTITAPVDGRLGVRDVDIGNIVSAGSSSGIVTLTTIEPIGVVFTLPQQDLPQIIDASKAGALPLSVVPEGDGSGPEETATLDVIDNQVDSSTGTVKFKAYFPNTDEHLWPGGFVTAHLTVKVLKDALTVPPAAVQTGPTQSFAYVLQPNNTVKQANVTLGQQNEKLAVIQSGLAAGDKVVLDGASRLSDGSKVKVVTPKTVTDQAAQGKGDQGPKGADKAATAQ